MIWKRYAFDKKIAVIRSGRSCLNEDISTFWNETSETRFYSVSHHCYIKVKVKEINSNDYDNKCRIGMIVITGQIQIQKYSMWSIVNFLRN